jgi:hypothetical protein
MRIVSLFLFIAISHPFAAFCYDDWMLPAKCGSFVDIYGAISNQRLHTCMAALIDAIIETHNTIDKSKNEICEKIDKSDSRLKLLALSINDLETDSRDRRKNEKDTDLSIDAAFARVINDVEDRIRRRDSEIELLKSKISILEMGLDDLRSKFLTYRKTTTVPAKNK